MKAIFQLRSSLPFEIFSIDDFHLIWPSKTHEANLSLLTRLIKSGDILKISRGLYTFSEFWRRKPRSVFMIANRLYEPSYVSFEAALSYHGLIPESVKVITSACIQKKKKIFNTSFGRFTYQFIPTAGFPVGVESIKTDAGPILMARPLKALFDRTYLMKAIYRSLADLEADLRIESEELSGIISEVSHDDLQYLGESYGRESCVVLMELLQRELHERHRTKKTRSILSTK